MRDMKLPRAILFDLDDTILVAFGPAQSQWQRTIAAFADQFGPIEATVIAAAIEAASTELWADPARHKYWRHRTGDAPTARHLRDLARRLRRRVTPHLADPARPHHPPPIGIAAVAKLLGMPRGSVAWVYGGHRRRAQTGPGVGYDRAALTQAICRR